MIKISVMLVSLSSGVVCLGMESQVVENPVSCTPDALIQAKANFNLGQMHLRGDGCERNYEKACQYFEKALEKNNDLELQAEACFHLGKIYYFGQGVVKDEQKMGEYLEKVCEIEKSYPSTLKAMKTIAEVLLNRNDAQKDLTPLHIAVYCNEKEELELLLAQGADIEAKGKDMTALHIAVGYGFTELVKLLIAKGAKVTSPDKFNGGTPLHYAAAYGHKEIVRLLLAAGVHIEATTNLGNTPLHSAAMNDQSEVVEQLLAKGANPTAQNNDGKTAFDLTESRYIKMILEMN